MGEVEHTQLIHPSRIPNRVQLIAGIVAMMAIANLKYAWTQFTKPLPMAASTIPVFGGKPKVGVA
jgi:hypothetical protein